MNARICGAAKATQFLLILAEEVVVRAIGHQNLFPYVAGQPGSLLKEPIRR